MAEETVPKKYYNLTSAVLYPRQQKLIFSDPRQESLFQSEKNAEIVNNGGFSSSASDLRDPQLLLEYKENSSPSTYLPLLNFSHEELLPALVAENDVPLAEAQNVLSPSSGETGFAENGESKKNRSSLDVLETLYQRRLWAQLSLVSEGYLEEGDLASETLLFWAISRLKTNALPATALLPRLHQQLGKLLNSTALKNRCNSVLLDELLNELVLGLTDDEQLEFRADYGALHSEKKIELEITSASISVLDFIVLRKVKMQVGYSMKLVQDGEVCWYAAKSISHSELQSLPNQTALSSLLWQLHLDTLGTLFQESLVNCESFAMDKV